MPRTKSHKLPTQDGFQNNLWVVVPSNHRRFNSDARLAFRIDTEDDDPAINISLHAIHHKILGRLTIDVNPFFLSSHALLTLENDDDHDFKMSLSARSLVVYCFNKSDHISNLDCVPF